MMFSVHQHLLEIPVRVTTASHATVVGPQPFMIPRSSLPKAPFVVR
jgi:hypothetical protein